MTLINAHLRIANITEENSMWKKDTPPEPPVEQPTLTRSNSEPVGGRSPQSNKPASPSPRSSVTSSNIGPEIEFGGEVRGKSDLIIAGNFEGKIALPSNTITIESSGFAKASMVAKIIVVYGKVEGRLECGEMVQVMNSGIVNGEISASKVFLDKGCKFNGTIEMLDDKPVQKATTSPPPRSTTQKAPAKKPSADPQKGRS